MACYTYTTNWDVQELIALESFSFYLKPELNKMLGRNLGHEPVWNESSSASLAVPSVLFLFFALFK